MDESLVSFVFRLAKRRSMPTGRMLAAQAGFSHLTNTPGEAAVGNLARIAGRDVAEISAISYGNWNSARSVFMGMEIPTTLLKGHVARRLICPLCLAENAYHRAIWDLSFASVCPVHQCEMIQSCPRCGNLLRWSGNDLTRCSCSADLTQAPTEPVAGELMDGVSTAYGLFGIEGFEASADQARLLPPLSDLGRFEAFSFIYRVGMDVTPGPRRKLFSLARPGDLDELPYLALHRGLAIAQRWPVSMQTVPGIVGQVWGVTDPKLAKRWLTKVRQWLSGLPEDQGGELKRVYGFDVHRVRRRRATRTLRP